MTLLGVGSFLRIHSEITRGISGGGPKKPSGTVAYGFCPWELNDEEKISCIGKHAQCTVHCTELGGGGEE